MQGRYGRLTLFVLLAAPLTARAQEAPSHRTLKGGAVLLMQTSGFNESMLAARFTTLRSQLVLPDLTAGIYFHNRNEFAELDAGIGVAADAGRRRVLTVSVGPSLLAALSGGPGRDVVFGAASRAALAVPFDVNLAVRFEVGLNVYQSGQFTTRLWMFGAGLTGLGIPLP